MRNAHGQSIDILFFIKKDYKYFNHIRHIMQNESINWLSLNERILFFRISSFKFRYTKSLHFLYSIYFVLIKREKWVRPQIPFCKKTSNLTCAEWTNFSKPIAKNRNLWYKRYKYMYMKFIWKQKENEVKTW